tara:strand:- start:5504 stop:5743 length:240 start_codon:yes stop_codon:yes gene_type:complete
MNYYAIYFRHHVLKFECYASEKEAIDFLINGECLGDLSTVGVLDGKKKHYAVISDGYTLGSGYADTVQCFDELKRMGEL